jgi:hypothetical protein
MPKKPQPPPHHPPHDPPAAPPTHQTPAGTPTESPHVSLPQFAFVFIDLTTDTTPANMKPGLVMDDMIGDISDQIDSEFADAHGLIGCSFRIGKGPNDRAPGEIAVHFRDTIPEAPGALAYHTVTNGVPDIEIGVDLFTNLKDDQESMTCGVDHEILETILDAGANGWKDLQDGSGLTRAEEACDTVQNVGYNGKRGCWLSDWLLPSAFVPGSQGPWDYLQIMEGPDDYSKGYEVQATAPMDASQVVGGVNKEVHGLTYTSGHFVFARGAEKLTFLQRKRKSHPYSRTYRRGVRL